MCDQNIFVVTLSPSLLSFHFQPRPAEDPAAVFGLLQIFLPSQTNAGSVSDSQSQIRRPKREDLVCGRLAARERRQVKSGNSKNAQDATAAALCFLCEHSGSV